LVLELPVAHATATAARFAQGAVHLLHACGCVDGLVFGSECGDTESLWDLADALDSQEFSDALKNHLDSGMTFAKARQLAIGEICGADAAKLLASPNNILGVEYLRAALELDWDAEAFTIERLGTGHDSRRPNAGYASASYLRENINALGDYVPPRAAEIYSKAAEDGMLPLNTEKFEDMMLSYLRRQTPENLAELPELSEGIEGRLYRAIRGGTSISGLEGIHNALKTKRYPMSRVRRLVMCAFLGITVKDVTQMPPYLHVLGMNERGKELAAQISRHGSLPLDTSLSKLREHSPACKRVAELEERATDLYTAALPTPLPCGYEYTASAVFPGKNI
jgi:predicted nucleotidyltransferase